MKPLMLITGPVATRSGYGSHARDLVRSLVAMDKFDIRINSLRWGNCPMNALNEQDPNDKIIVDRIMKDGNLDRQPDVHIQISVPNEFNPLAKYNIGVTAGIETTVCPPVWIEGLNRMDLNIVPASFIFKSLSNTVFDKHDQQTGQKIAELRNEKPLEVLFEGADPDVYKPTKEFSKDLVDTLEEIEEDFCFLFVGHWLQGKIGQDRKDTGMLV